MGLIRGPGRALEVVVWFTLFLLTPVKEVIKGHTFSHGAADLTAAEAVLWGSFGRGRRLLH